MVALTRDFNVLASRVTTRLSAVLFSVSHIAEAWDVRALSGLSIRHLHSVLSTKAIVLSFSLHADFQTSLSPIA
jgi:hypothetical protein